MKSFLQNDHLKTGMNFSITGAGLVYGGVKLTQAAQTERRNTRLEVTSHFTKLMKREITPLFYAGVRTSHTKIDGKQVLKEIDDWAQHEYNNPNCKDKQYVEKFLNAHQRYDLHVNKEDNQLLNYKPAREVNFVTRKNEKPFATVMRSMSHTKNNKNLTCVIQQDELDKVMNDARSYASEFHTLLEKPVSFDQSYTPVSFDQSYPTHNLSTSESTGLNRIEGLVGIMLVSIVFTKGMVQVVLRGFTIVKSMLQHFKMK